MGWAQEARFTSRQHTGEDMLTLKDTHHCECTATDSATEWHSQAHHSSPLFPRVFQAQDGEVFILA
jgi:hypothetical protein